MLDQSQIHFQKFTKKEKKIPIIKICDGIVCILPALTYYGRNPLNVNAGRILPGFGRKWWIIEKLDYILIQINFDSSTVPSNKIHFLF